MLKDRSRLTTERPNARSRNIDRSSTLQIVDIINAEDRKVAPAVGRQRRRIAAAVELIVKAFRGGGRLIYVGAGTSGRLGVLDAAECPPTFGTRPSMVRGIIAGGRRALVRAVEGAEDDAAAGRAAMDDNAVGPRDAVVAIATSGITPYVRAALARARRRRARTIFITCSPQVTRYTRADVIINPVVGPEVVTGSTRMKAGTATKLVLNTLTTAAMIRMGKVHGNLMVDLKATNAKLRDRARRIIQALTGLSRAEALRLLRRARGEVKPAVVMHVRKVGLKQAGRLLRDCGGSLRRTMERGPVLPRP
ncbi:MAG TPA: N-acetylmuramic acid 6-phosphate etherase [Phycisphaerae bacterium]|nr:N-acetylmuramic acid 6-phosphate etherase [Phycisphaerae bacterium]HUT61922.1 N-acetylmuramic acid 6-phosphate etherase [Phycisphaerae bacterium]